MVQLREMPIFRKWGCICDVLFSAFHPERRYKAFNTFAASYDLVHWTDWKGADLVIPSKEYDEMFAHKSYVIKHNGVVYHFYCAVNNSEQRGLPLPPVNRWGVRPYVSRNRIQRAGAR